MYASMQALALHAADLLILASPGVIPECSSSLGVHKKASDSCLLLHRGTEAAGKEMYLIKYM